MQALEGLIYDAQEQLGDIESALGNKADQETVLRLSTELTQTAQGITAVINRVETVESENAEVGEILAAYQLTFRMDADGVTIGKKATAALTYGLTMKSCPFGKTGRRSLM